MPNSARSRTSAVSGTERERVRTDGHADQQVAQDRRQPDEPADDDDDDGGAEQDENQLQRLRHRAGATAAGAAGPGGMIECSTGPLGYTS